MSQSSKDYNKAKSLAMLRFLLLILLPPLLMIPIVGRLVSDPDPDDHQRWAYAAEKLRNYPVARDQIWQLIQADPLTPRLHVRYVNIHFKLPEQMRNDETLFDEYENWTRSPDSARWDLGYLALGQAYLLSDQPEKALESLQQIQNQKLRYLNTLRGRALEKLHEFNAAQEAFQAAIETNGDIAGAVQELAILYLAKDDIDSLQSLYEEDALRPYLPDQAVRQLAMRKGRIGLYLWSLVEPLGRSGNVVGITGAFLILIVWVYFLRRLDPFEPEKLRYVLLTIGLGMLTPFIASVLYDLFELFVGLQPGVSGGRDLLYCIFGIGLIEESVKLLPVLILIKFTREVNESTDYLIYAALGALGFSFVENILYFHDASLFVIKERGMLCCIGHMFYSSLILYGLVLARYGRRGTVAGNLLFCFVLAFTFHGIYDFFLITNLFPGGRFLALGLALLQAIIFVRMLNNTLNQSEYFDEGKALRFQTLRQHLGIALVGIVLFEYMGLALRYGPTLTYHRLIPVLGFTWFLVLFFASTLGTYTVRRRLWTPLWKRRPTL